MNKIDIPYTFDKEKKNKNTDCKTIRLIKSSNLSFIKITQPKCKRKGIENFYNKSLLTSSKITNIEYIGKREVYNLETESHTYFANNFAVHNCYEQSGRNRIKKHKTLSEEEIDEYLNEIMTREKYCQNSTLAIFGGEPFLEVGKMEYIKKKLIESNHSWGIEIFTNATRLMDIPKEKLQFICKSVSNVCVCLTVSYDGSGHHRRVFKNGHPTIGIVEENMRYLKKLNIPFAISYSVHKDNHKNILRDVIEMMEKWKPSKVELSVAWQELADNGYDGWKIKKSFVSYACNLFKRYGIPVCDVSCPVCKRCDRSHFEGNAYFTP